ncbi:UNVERIFIED_CONTAM: 3-dehydroquinate dehydratase (3-dehydroquinase) [Siphonaria sp. JEL0065]|nr:3-dehydroquinate dehydratase (3-dehydroquinase) [Siphonaria sp. JEL0065]
MSSSLKRTRSSTWNTTGSTATTNEGSPDRSTKRSKAVSTIAIVNAKAAFTTFKHQSSRAALYNVSVLGSESVTLGFGITAYTAQQIVKLIPASTYLNATDANVAPLHLVALQLLYFGRQLCSSLCPPNRANIGVATNQAIDCHEYDHLTHPALPTRALLGLIPAKKFYLFGYPIAQSMSPTLHNAGFQTLGLPYKYTISENANWSHVKAMLDEGMKHGSFGGASVTIPHKEEIMKHNLVATLTEAATKIGAVNTIMVDSAGKLKRASVEGYDLVGGVIGAGGPSRAPLFAFKSLGVTDIRIWNRTEAKAAALAEEFDGKAVSNGYENIFDKTPASASARLKLFLLVSSVPGASQNDLPIDELFTNANAGAPAGSVGVFVEMAYRPRQTVIIVHLGSIERTNLSWSYVEGVKILIEQGLEQFTRWTERRAPRKVIEEAVYTNYK